MMFFSPTSFDDLRQMLNRRSVFTGAMLQGPQGEINQRRRIRHPAKHTLAAKHYFGNLETVPTPLLVPHNFVGRDVELKNLSSFPPIRSANHQPNQKSRQKEEHYQRR